MSYQHISPNLQYVAKQEHYRFFFLDEVFRTSERIAKKLGEKTQVRIFPDADIKDNGLPTGIACYSKAQDAILFPYILRDPGCGYLLFSLEFDGEVANDTQVRIGQLLECVNNPSALMQYKQFYLNSINLLDILYHGLEALNIPTADYAGLAYAKFNLDPSRVNFTEEELQTLANDFMVLTNFIEIRKPFQIEKSQLLQNAEISSKSYIGFIHSGSDAFPSILHQRFTDDIARYAFKHDLSEIDEISAGIFGIPLQSTLGTQYYYWIQAAMNFALVSRYCIFQVIKQLIESQFPCKINLINDNPHAGIFSKIIDGKDYLYTTRGIQHLASNNNARLNISLLAGQRESIAALVTDSHNSAEYHHLLAHGTSYKILSDHDYKNEFDTEEAELYQQFAKNTFYNSQPQLAQCLPYNFNFKTAVNDIAELNLIEPIAYLAPWINIRSRLL